MAFLSKRTITAAIGFLVLMTEVAINTSFAQESASEVQIEPLDFGTKMLWAAGSIIPAIAQYDIPIRLYEQPNSDVIDRYVSRYPEHVRWFIVYSDLSTPSGESTYWAIPIGSDGSFGRQLEAIQGQYNNDRFNTWIGASTLIDELNPASGQPIFRADLRSFDWSAP